MFDLTESHVALARVIDALFCSELETDSSPTRQEVAAAIRQSVKRYRNWNGCTRAVAAAFSNLPEPSTRREQWCRQLASDVLRANGIHLGTEELE